MQMRVGGRLTAVGGIRRAPGSPDRIHPRAPTFRYPADGRGGRGSCVCELNYPGPVPDPLSFRPAPGTIPEAPGVYRWRDATGRVIYVGKAKSLRQRLNSYFADLGGLHPRTAQMVRSAASVEWTVVSTEVEALQL